MIAQSQRETGDIDEVDGIRMAASAALDSYLSLPVSEDTFKFWRDYSRTTDKAQKSLCKLARKYLTPAPTSTDVERDDL